MERSYADVVVIGAGPAGLVLTELLTRNGMSVAVVERQSDPTRSPQGALLQPVTLDLLHRLVGFAHSADEVGAITAIEEYGPSGRLFSGAFADLPGSPAGHALNITQGRLRRLLLDRVAGHPAVSVRLGTEVRRLAATDVGGCRTVVAPADGTGAPHTLESRWVVAADGKGSETRDLTGVETWIDEAEHTLRLVPVPTPGGFPRTIRAHRRPDGMATVVPDASPGTTFVFTHLTPAALGHDPSPGTAPGGPIAPERIVDWVVRAIGADDPVLTEALRAAAPRDRIITIEPQTVNAVDWRRDGVLLLGDSAHGMHNIGGQGLNTSIQDAILLADALRRHGDDGKTAWVDDFIRARRPYIDAFQEAQRALGRAFWPDGGGTSWFAGRFEELSLGQADLRDRWYEVIDG
ncbi:FAD-dependent oxidoreductase [Streptomyces sp. NPDC047928]|uniref:FAD-dependent oxidoreductase n=1 Tax=unclassified Streptomyces TaxID=2593676 RepID=UPI003721C1D7